MDEIMPGLQTFDAGLVVTSVVLSHPLPKEAAFVSIATSYASYNASNRR